MVEAALRHLRDWPTLPALEILDYACRDYEGTDPDFESCDELTGQPHAAYLDDTDPYTPFGELLRRAFAPELDPRELMLLAVDEPVSPDLLARKLAAADQWQTVIERFARRYRLWSGGA